MNCIVNSCIIIQLCIVQYVLYSYVNRTNIQVNKCVYLYAAKLYQMVFNSFDLIRTNADPIERRD